VSRDAYRLVEWPSLRDLPGSRIVLDSAIEAARTLSKGTDAGVGVMDHDRSPALLRGVAQGGRWSWAIDCKQCKGTGHQGAYMGGKVPCGERQCTGRKPENFQEKKT